LVIISAAALLGLTAAAALVFYGTYLLIAHLMVGG